MKKTIAMALAAVLAFGCLGCSCGKTSGQSSAILSSAASSAVSAASSAVSQIGGGFKTTGFGIIGVKTKNWKSFQTYSPETVYQFSLPLPPSWTPESGSAYEDGRYTSGTKFFDAAGTKPYMAVRAPVVISVDDKLPATPESASTEYGGNVISVSDISFYGISGKLVIRDLSGANDATRLYQYFLSDGDVVYRVDFYYYEGESDTAVFDYIMSELTSGK